MQILVISSARTWSRYWNFCKELQDSYRNKKQSVLIIILVIFSARIGSRYSNFAMEHQRKESISVKFSILKEQTAINDRSLYKVKNTGKVMLRSSQLIWPNHTTTRLLRRAQIYIRSFIAPQADLPWGRVDLWIRYSRRSSGLFIYIFVFGARTKLDSVSVHYF